LIFLLKHVNGEVIYTVHLDGRVTDISSCLGGLENPGTLGLYLEAGFDVYPRWKFYV